ncbi:MAG: mannose-6-phosphate isomerase [Paludibacteraceae bacterium]|nr:mannose-6-phosphate isomerase [Paludibacteraceae bacterium]
MIYHFYPIDRPMIWGAEQWILSAYPGRDSICVETGQNIWHMLCEQKEQLVGKHVFARYGDTFPLLIKFIDAHDDLSIQVHPSDELAQKYGEPFGKTEMWYALPSEPGARLYCGLKQQLTPDEYKQMVADKTIISALAEYEVRDGDGFFIPAGRIHAIGSGCQLCEIQQTSDTTYRIYDYDRRDKDGNPRELHTERAAECIDYTVHDDYRAHYTPCPNEPVNIVTCPYFTTNVLQVTEPIVRDYSRLDSFICLICLDGECTIEETDNGATTTITQGELVLLTATTGDVRLSGSFRALEVYID